MSIEAGVLVDFEGDAIYWHTPAGRSGGALPDDRNLWDVIWENRERLAGFAHSHPGSGSPGPSGTDLTTFAAIEAGIGRRLSWWVISSDRYALARWNGEKYANDVEFGWLPWLERLRELSNYNKMEVSDGK